MKKKSNKAKRELRVGRIVLNLNQDEFEFIDNIGRNALFSTGKRLTNNKILRVFLNVMRELKIDGRGLSSCGELKERMLAVLRIKGERRKFPRFRKEVKVSWRKLESMSKYEKGETIEIGEGGFRIELDKKRKVGEILEFTINDPSMPDNPIKAFGRITWIKRRVNDNVLEAGIHLRYLPKEDKDRFNRLFYEEFKEELIKNEHKL